MPKQKVLIVAGGSGSGAGARATAENIRTALGRFDINAEIIRTTGVDDLATCTQHIKEKGREYDGVILANLAYYQQARTTDRALQSQIPDMFAWAHEVQNSIPNVLVYDDFGELMDMGARHKFSEASIALRNPVSTLPTKIADEMHGMINGALMGRR